MASAFSQEDSDLIHRLNKLSDKNPKLVKHSDYVAPGATDMTIRSWKMNEFKYYEIPSPFPTLARGLFSTEIIEKGKKRTGDDKEYRIVIRGYDKFFNIGEVPWTTWASLEEHTSAPYTLSLKSNGCIIFIAALTPSKLLVTSKHAIGRVGDPTEDQPNESHSEVGERWLKKHLQKVGKTTDELAATLWEKDWTAVAELCDDAFEEHVLPCPPEKTGLHLHGLNESTREFKTQPSEVVDKFAAEWGFILTKTTVLNSIPEIKAFTETVGQSGEWNGEALEGFVVRTRVAEPHNGRTQPPPPYATGNSLFFKIKFDEPYMMYRDWREATKSLLSAKGSLDDAKIPKSKMMRPETKIYVNWVKGEIRRDRSQFETFSKGKGIIATRERFLKWLESDQGKTAQQDVQDTVENNVRFGKTIIVPIAIPGSGKTALAVALARLFGFGHTQSDDIHVKKAAPAFIKNVVNLLKDHDVVIADRNNHLRQHREALREAVAKMNPPVRLLALNWTFDQPISTIHRICGDRVLTRGEDHQTLRADMQSKGHEDVIWKFISERQDLAENEVDSSIDMDIEEPMEQALDHAIEGCVRILGLQKPDQEKVNEALAFAREYTPKKKKQNEKKDVSKPRFLGFLPEVDLKGLLDPVFSKADAPEDGRKFWNNLVEHERILKKPHITIVHSKTLPDDKPLWDQCMNLHLISKPPLFKFRLGSVVWNDRVMAITVENVAVDKDGPNKEGAKLVTHLQDLEDWLHITVATRDKDVPPFEARGLLESWKKGEDVEGVGSLSLSETYSMGRVKGLQY